MSHDASPLIGWRLPSALIIRKGNRMRKSVNKCACILVKKTNQKTAHCTSETMAEPPSTYRKCACTDKEDIKQCLFAQRIRVLLSSKETKSDEQLELINSEIECGHERPVPPAVRPAHHRRAVPLPHRRRSVRHPTLRQHQTPLLAQRRWPNTTTTRRGCSASSATCC